MKNHNEMQAELPYNKRSPCSGQFVLFCLFYAVGTVIDVASMFFLNFLLWSTISALDVLWFHLFLTVFYDHETSMLGIVSLCVFLTGVVLCFSQEPGDLKKTESGWTYFWDAWTSKDYYFTEWCVFGGLIAFIVLGHIYLFIKYKRRQNNPENYEPGYQPHPTSLLNVVGILVNAVTMALFAFTVFILANTVFPPKYDLFSGWNCWYAFLLWAVFFGLSYLSETMTMNLLHFKSQLMGTVMFATSFQFIIVLAIWGIEFKKWWKDVLWYSGIGLQIIGCLLWIVVQQFVEDSDRLKLMNAGEGQQTIQTLQV